MDVTIARQEHSKYISTGTDTDTIIEDAAFSVLSIAKLYHEDQLDKHVSAVSRRWLLSALSCIVNSRYLAVTSKQTEGFMCSCSCNDLECVNQ